jgi:hypothetical protein
MELKEISQAGATQMQARAASFERPNSAESRAALIGVSGTFEGDFSCAPAATFSSLSSRFS